jgi:hypothetical protein
MLIQSRRRWFGDQRLGAFGVYVDGTRVGTIPPLGRLELQVMPGVHVVRIRQWWYRSRPTQITAASGGTVLLDADMSHRGSFGRRLTTYLLNPSAALSLSDARQRQDERGVSEGSALQTPGDLSPRRSVVIVLMTIGFVVACAGFLTWAALSAPSIH